MKKIFIDTNIWVRFFIKDDKEQFELTKMLLTKIEEGNFRPYTSTIVFLELQFVLLRIYNLSFEGVIEIFEIIRGMRNITVIEKTNLDVTIKFLKQYKLRFPDCLIASQLPKDTVLVSFDEELPKIKEIEVKNPQQLLRNH